MYSVDGLTMLASKRSKHASSAEAEVAGQFGSVVDCLPVIDTCRAAPWARDRFQNVAKTLEHAREGSAFASNMVELYYLTCGSFYTACVVIPWGLILLAGQLSTGDFITLVSLCAGMVQPLTMLGGFMRNASNYSGAIQTVQQVISHGEEMQKKQRRNDKSSGVNGTSLHKLEPLHSSLQVKNVTYRYPGSSIDVLKGVDVDISKGKYVAVFGGSGSGKSTLLDVLMQYKSPRLGQVEWDGLNIDLGTRESFRKEVAVMFQRTMILQGTVRENITFGLPNDPDKVEEAAEMAEIATVIRGLPDGYETHLVAGTSTMSGGQLQRICLARALYRNPSVLLLDECTSALDPISEAAIINTFIRLRETDGLTIVSVSHHPSTAIDADLIVVLDKGIIAEEGKYDELVGIDGGIFRSMVEAAPPTA